MTAGSPAEQVLQLLDAARESGDPADFDALEDFILRWMREPR